MKFVVSFVAVILPGVVLAQPVPNDPSLLKSLTVEQAEALAGRDYLPIGGVATLSPEAAKALLAHKGTLYLQGLSSLSLEVAKVLGQHKGEGLRLYGLKELTPEVAEELAKHPGLLDLSGLPTLSPEVAQALAQHADRLDLMGLTEISDRAVAALAQHKDEINLPFGISGKVAEKREQWKRSQEEAAEALMAKRREQDMAAVAALAEQRRQFSLPRWEGYEDLNQLLKSFGGVNQDSLNKFVRYGTPELAKKASDGDRFDREEADEAAAEHRASLKQRLFTLQCDYRWDEREPSKGKQGFVRLRVPLSFRGLISQDNANVGVAAYNEHELWFLTKEGAIKQCQNALEARLVAESDGVLYVPEIIGTSELVVWVGGPREVQKAIAREPGQHILNIGITELGLERPHTKGFYKLEMIRLNDHSSGSLLSAFQHGLNGPEQAPNYFVTKVLNPADESSMPLVLSARIEKVEIVNVSGKERSIVFTWSGK